jgi:hypothetical protein
MPSPAWQSGGQVMMLIVAPLQVFTPLVRPFFGCAGDAASCTVNVSSQVAMRYEGV